MLNLRPFFQNISHGRISRVIIEHVNVTVLHSHTVTNFGDLAGAKTSNLLQGRGTRQGMIASPYASHVSRLILGVPYSSLCVCVRKGLGKTVHLYSLCALCKLHS